MHKNAIKSVFEAFLSQKIANKGYKFSSIFELSLNLPHKKRVLKYSKKALHYIASHIVFRIKWTLTAIFPETGAIPTLNKSPNSAICGRGGPFHSNLTNYLLYTVRRQL